MKRFFHLLMTLWFLLSGIFISGLPLFAQNLSQPGPTSSKEHRLSVPGEIVVKVRPEMTPDEIRVLNRAHDAKLLENNSTLGIYLLKVSKPIEETIPSYRSHASVEYAQPNYILAEVGGELITLLDMQLAIERIILPLRRHYTQPAAKETLLRSLLNEKLFMRAAKEDGLDRLQEVQRKINEAVSRTLAREYKNRIERAPVSEKELIAYYEENIEKYRQPEQIKGRLILVRTKQEAEEILAHIKAGTPFNRLAKERSIDPTAKNGGQFGWFGRGRMVPALESVAFALNKGEMSGIIATRLGYYIVKVEDKRDPGEVPFQKVRERIERILETKKREDLVERKAKELEEKYQVNLNLESLPEVQVSVTGGTGQEQIMQIIQEFVERPY